MGQAAVAVAREIGYVGAGTVEFLLDPDGRFHFMEMNTRLQVEHPVTELVTGLDLVELQLRIARGEPLPLAQADVRLAGHAVEVRLCAEEPADDFLPRTGTVVDWRPDELTRCDHAIEPGMTVSPHYDSMLAKVIAHGSTRSEALDRLARALDRTVLLGVPSNRSFLARVLRHPAFADGAAVSTAFVERHYPGLEERTCIPDDATWALAAWLSTAAAPEAARASGEWRHWGSGRPLPVPWRLDWHAPQSLSAGTGLSRSGRALLTQAGAEISTGDAQVRVRGCPVDRCADGEAGIDGKTVLYRYAWQGNRLWLHTRAADYEFHCRRREPGRSPADSDARGGDVRAAINGRVVELVVAQGDAVVAGQRLLALEAMKMEHELRAPLAGRVAAVEVRAGDQVAPGQLLVRIERGT
jgi:geranyl-CoA carboxylase alpha subunit